MVSPSLGAGLHAHHLLLPPLRHPNALLPWHIGAAPPARMAGWSMSGEQLDHALHGHARCEMAQDEAATFQ